MYFIMYLINLIKCLELLKVPNVHKAMMQIDTYSKDSVNMINFFKNIPTQTGGGSIILNSKN